jgi:hypothetical protein
VKAESRGDHASASRAFAEADMLAPSVASLEAALESAMRADDAPLGAELLDRAEARVTDTALVKTLEAAKKRFAGRTGKVRADCAFAQSCLVAVDGVARDATRAVHVAVGAHAVVVERDGVRLERLVQVRSGEVVVLAPEERGPVLAAPRPAGGRDLGLAAPVAPSPARGGLSPVWFFASAAVTFAVGAASYASALDASGKHEAFERAGCGFGSSGPVATDCGAKSSDGQRAETRTWVLLGAAGGLAALSAFTGVFLVRWGASRPAPRLAALGPWASRGGAGASLELRWR